MLEGIGAVRPPDFEGPKGSRDKRSPAPPPAPGGSDKVELSQAARLLARLHAMPDIREEKVEEVRQQVLQGTYLTEEKIARAVDRLVDDFLAGL